MQRDAERWQAEPAPEYMAEVKYMGLLDLMEDLMEDIYMFPTENLSERIDSMEKKLEDTYGK